MPLAGAIPDMNSAMQSIQDTLHDVDGELPNIGELWSGVAEAFFSNGANPAWSAAGLEAGKAAFAAAFGASVPAAETSNGFCVKLKAAFQAFGGVAANPAFAVPTPAPGQIPPVVPPPAPPNIESLSSPPSDSYEPMIAEIHAKLIPWASTGLVSVPSPGGPVPTTPWA